MKTLLFSITIAITLAFAPSYGQSVKQIIENNITAMGGRDKLSAVKTLQAEQYLTRVGVNLTSSFNTYTVVGQSIRVEIIERQRVIIQSILPTQL